MPPDDRRHGGADWSRTCKLHRNDADDKQRRTDPNTRSECRDHHDDDQEREARLVHHSALTAIQDAVFVFRQGILSGEQIVDSTVDEGDCEDHEPEGYR